MNGVYQFDSQGVPQLLSTSQGLLFSPDGKFFVTTDWDDLYLEGPGIEGKKNLTQSPGIVSSCVYWADDGTWMIIHEGTVINIEGMNKESGDLYRLSLANGERLPLTETPKLNEHFIRIWPGRPNLALVAITDETFIPGPTSGIPGSLHILNLDSRQLMKISNDQETHSVSFMPGLNGKPSDRFIFRDNENFYIYVLGQGMLPYQFPTVVNAPNKTYGWLGAPVWSPDGRWLAWHVLYQGKTGWGVIDVPANTARFFHPFTHVGMGGHYEVAEFSPDSQWLILDAEHAEESELRGTWLYSLQGDEVIHLPGGNPLFNPDGRYLMLTEYVPLSKIFRFHLVTCGSWERREITLPGATGLYVWR